MDNDPIRPNPTTPDGDQSSLLMAALDPLSGLPHPPPLPFAAPWHYELHFPCDPRGSGIARLTLRAVLSAHGLAELADRAELLASELATNSVRHTKGPATVRLQWLCPVLRVTVWDTSPDLPPTAPPITPPPHADGGRGMLILDTVAERWGGCAIGDGPYGPGGKTVWFELSLPEESPPTLAA
ncbi:ATP-binding protein [Streptomyces sp. NBC_00286]|uniref:ATP-binding protein n=1 Tax=Streptomyces sp. NBC_00286 TaxID=2975701 RepID=UPI002E29B72A|nr:ATP-binding protein [Streptomyces sp. NBC_00286]